MNHHNDIFSGLFGGAAGLLSTAEALINNALTPKSDDIVVPVSVTLSDVYLGKQKPVLLEQKKGCTGCRSTGRVMTQCRACHGNGITMCTVQLVPGIIQQVPRECQLCRRTGYSGRGNCPMCHGVGVLVEKRFLEVQIPRNAKSRQEIVFHGMGHHLPRTEPGDAIVILQVSSHPTFMRRGSHLFLEKTITLTEAICGVKLTIETLDGRHLYVCGAPGSIIMPSSVRTVVNEGMPIASSHSRHLSYGNLYIKFTVIFPDKLDSESCEKLRSLLPSSPPLDIDRTREDVEEVGLAEYQPTLIPDDSESEDEMGPGIQCVHQ